MANGTCIRSFGLQKQTLLDRAKTDRVPYDVWAKQGLLRTTPGSMVDYDYVVKDIAEILADFDIEVIAFDRWRIQMFKKAAENIGLSLPLVEFGQGYKDMAPALDKLEQMLLNKQIRHGNHPVMNMCAANAITIKDASSNRKLTKEKSTGRMDGMVAFAMAVGASNGVEIEHGDIDGFFDDPIMVGF